MKHADKKLDTPDASSYQSLNEGNGALIITSTPEDVISVAEAEGHEAKVAGEIVEDTGIKIKSKGVTNPGEWIHFIPKAA